MTLPLKVSILPSVSSGEASSGVVRAYAGTISKVLDRQKPRSGGRTGKVQVQFVIDTAGKSAVPVVLASSGNQRLDEIVVEAIQRMDFPAPPPQMSERQRTFKVPFAFR